MLFFISRNKVLPKNHPDSQSRFLNTTTGWKHPQKSLPHLTPAPLEVWVPSVVWLIILGLCHPHARVASQQVLHSPELKLPPSFLHTLVQTNNLNCPSPTTPTFLVFPLFWGLPSLSNQIWTFFWVYKIPQALNHGLMGFNISRK